ncbi:hypothetical protein [Actinoplanes sp. NPDC051494]|uniref:hypothetical protein n=1 Tax=Actinoplanes sp. NPDC051494 TaxID=3363907 RepID=UPI0037B36497
MGEIHVPAVPAKTTSGTAARRPVHPGLTPQQQHLVTLQRAAGNSAVTALLERAPVAGTETESTEKRYKQTTSSGPGTRPADLRALDRLARVLYAALNPGKSTPHLATIVDDGILHVAGNTAKRSVNQEEQSKAIALLKQVADDAVRTVPDRFKGDVNRWNKDFAKVRALATGDYAAVHSEIAGMAESLDVIARAMGTLTKDSWPNVEKNRGPKGPAEHGELTLLGQIHEKNKDRPETSGGSLEEIKIGGVKLACGACQLAYDAYNQEFAEKRGYKVVASGTHEGFFPGWKAPKYLWDIPAVRARLMAGLPSTAWSLTADGVLEGAVDLSAAQGPDHNPGESSSDWDTE